MEINKAEIIKMLELEEKISEPQRERMIAYCKKETAEWQRITEKIKLYRKNSNTNRE
jgi:hypothetical protein